ncbi:HAD family hydrolase [Geminicoccaceae bacterium 1502E]|nr:HAD family hydrolase [Geminicoccaceae bacterium 1502E]
MQRTELVIFDCDGVLVDSEPLAAAVLAEALRELGFAADEAFVYRHFLGKSVATMRRIFADELRWELPEDFVDGLLPRLQRRFRDELQAIDGMAGLIRGLGVPCCVASSSSPDRLHLALELAGLLPLVTPHVFSATMVPRGKPWPDLFLLAAERMGAAPGRCVVVEDSEAGVQAARAAGMRVVGFTGGGHAASPEHRAMLEAAGASAIAASAAELPALLDLGEA